MFMRMTITACLLFCFAASYSRAAELKDFPSQTHWILSVDMKAAQASPIMKFIVDKLDADKRQEAERKLAAARAVFGIDLLKDIDNLVIAGNGDAEKGGVAYVYGQFDVPRLTAIIGGSQKFESVDHHGISILSWVDEKDNKAKCLAFAKPGLMMLSNTRNTLADAVDVVAGNKPGLDPSSPLSKAFVRSNQDLLSLNAFGIASIVGAAPKAEALRRAESLSLNIRTPDSDSLTADLQVTATSEQTATQIHQALLGVQAIALLRAAEAPEPAALASQAKVVCNSRTVGVTLNLPKNLIENTIRARAAKPAAGPAQPAAAAPAAATKL